MYEIGVGFMVRTIDEGFRIFHERLTPSLVESEAAKSHRKSIEKALKREFDIISFFRTGSFGNGTSLRSYSDVDYFAVIPHDNIKEDSSEMLREVKGVLSTRFSGTNIITVRSPAVVIPFGSDASETTEVVPAKTALDDNGDLIYKIPDGNGGWMPSNPKSHNEYVNSVNNNLNKKVKPLIRFIKSWKYERTVPISSFYLELRVAKYASKESAIVYKIDIRSIFKMLSDIGLADMQDPKGISGYISPCSTESKKEDAISKLNTVLRRVQEARDAESEGDIEKAFDKWRLALGYKFPAYG